MTRRIHGRRLVFAAVLILLLQGTTVWGYFFDDRREMSLSGFAYSRATLRYHPTYRHSEGQYRVGNLVQHRNFFTLECVITSTALPVTCRPSVHSCSFSSRRL